MKKMLLAFALSLFSIGLNAQSVVLTSGSLDFLDGEKVFQFEFTYNDMLVGKKTEQEYVDEKVKHYNEKEPGRGDNWHENWIADRKKRFEPKFIEAFNKYMENYGLVAGNDDANYLFVFNTDFTEPGFNVGVARRPPTIDLSVAVIEIASGRTVATFVIKKAFSNIRVPVDFDTGFRLEGTYAMGGKMFARFLVKKAKLKKI